MSAGVSFTQRAAQRFNQVLDEEGYPLDLLGRSRTVSQGLGTDLQAATHLLSGVVPWTWDQLQAVCEWLGKQPGYFLDPDVAPGMPSDTHVITSADGGETIALRLPKGFLSYEVKSSDKLRYLTQRERGIAHLDGSLLIYAEYSTARTPLVEGAAYVIDRNGSLHVMTCKAVRDLLASFESSVEPGLAIMVPLSEQPDEQRPRIVGLIVASIGRA